MEKDPNQLDLEEYLKTVQTTKEGLITLMQIDLPKKGTSDEK
jgi:hypothetical protein